VVPAKLDLQTPPANLNLSQTAIAYDQVFQPAIAEIELTATFPVHGIHNRNRSDINNVADLITRL
jgi:hypothetical protein